jgi:hypothetical protein
MCMTAPKKRTGSSKKKPVFNVPRKTDDTDSPPRPESPKVQSTLKSSAKRALPKAARTFVVPFVAFVAVVLLFRALAIASGLYTERLSLLSSCLPNAPLYAKTSNLFAEEEFDELKRTIQLMNLVAPEEEQNKDKTRRFRVLFTREGLGELRDSPVYQPFAPVVDALLQDESVNLFVLYLSVCRPGPISSPVVPCATEVI